MQWCQTASTTSATCGDADAAEDSYLTDLAAETGSSLHQSTGLSVALQRQDKLMSHSESRSMTQCVVLSSTQSQQRTSHILHVSLTSVLQQLLLLLLLLHLLLLIILEMSANAQRDSRPAEYRWHPLFNAAKFG